MNLKDFMYELPSELIAQEPAKQRDKSRLLVLDRSDGSIRELMFYDILHFFKAGDVLAVNDTKVIPARLEGVRQTGGKFEVFLLKKISGKTWLCLVKPGQKFKVGSRFNVGNANGVVLERTPNGERVIEIDVDEEELLSLGKVPLPPYIHSHNIDPDRYQTVYANRKGAVAAPTAGLHFTNELLSEIQNKGVKLAKITLHVGLGTFRPIKTDNIDEHKMEYEWFEVSNETAETINSARAKGGFVFACGTTVVRTLESCATDDGVVQPKSGETNLFIKPGYKFRAIDKLITNFHLPGSTLLLLVSAFATREMIFEAYEQAVKGRFRFFSFGDAMIIL